MAARVSLLILLRSRALNLPRKRCPLLLGPAIENTHFGTSFHNLITTRMNIDGRKIRELSGMRRSRSCDGPSPSPVSSFVRVQARGQVRSLQHRQQHRQLISVIGQVKNVA